MFQRVIIHPGQAHRDELMALGVLLHAGAIDLKTPVYRMEPNEYSRQDPGIALVDVGGEYNPELGNFDHHQLPRNVRECAMSLVAKNFKVLGHDFTYDELFDGTPWYETTITLDSQGPTALAKDLGLPRLPFELISPIESAILSDLERYQLQSLDKFLLEVAALAMTSKVNDALRLRSALAELDQRSKMLDIMDLKVLVFEGPPFGIQAWLDRRKIPVPAISITRDDRGPGWALYRFNDHPRVDFSVLARDPDVGFAHNGGFIAKTVDCSIDRAIELTKQAIKA